MHGLTTNVLATQSCGLEVKRQGTTGSKVFRGLENRVRNLSKVGREIKSQENSQRDIRDIQRTRGPNETKERI